MPLHSTGKGTLSKPAGACAVASQAGALPFVASASPSVLWVVGYHLEEGLMLGFLGFWVGSAWSRSLQLSDCAFYLGFAARRDPGSFPLRLRVQFPLCMLLVLFWELGLAASGLISV